MRSFSNCKVEKLFLTVTFCPKQRIPDCNLSYTPIACSTYFEPFKNAVSTVDTDDYFRVYCQLPP